MGNTEVSIALLSAVAAVAFVLFVLATVAYRRRQNQALAFLVLAFLVFAIKNTFAAISISMALVPHEHLEVYEGLSDLVVVGLLIAPYFVR